MWPYHEFFGPGQFLVWPDQKLLPVLVLGPKMLRVLVPPIPFWSAGSILVARKFTR